MITVYCSVAGCRESTEVESLGGVQALGIPADWGKLRTGDPICPRHASEARVGRDEPRLRDSILARAVKQVTEEEPKNDAEELDRLLGEAKTLAIAVRGLEERLRSKAGAGTRTIQEELALQLEERDAELRLEYVDETAQILFTAAVASQMEPTTPFQARGHNRAELLGERAYKLAGMLWTARQKFLGDERLRTEQARAAETAARELAEATESVRLASDRQEPDSMLKVAGKTFRCLDCGANVFHRIPYGGGVAESPDAVRHPIERGRETRVSYVPDLTGGRGEWKVLGSYVSHFAKCPHAAQHRNPKGS